MTIISGNLNLWGDNGYFEADRSTWGFGSYDITRFSGLYTQGTHSALFEWLGATQPAPPINYIKGKFNYTAGKKYLIRAKAYNGGPGLMDNNASVISIERTGAHFSTVAEVTKTLADSDSLGWVQISVQVLCTTSGNDPVAVLVTPYDGSTNVYENGLLFVDEFEIFEYEDEEETPTCTLLIDVGGTVIEDSTGSDGSIDIATTGGVGTLEYSNDNGASWQSSPLFTGLAVGVYQCKVREVDTPDCVSSYTFNVPADTYVFDFTTAKTDETVLGANDGTITVTVTGTGSPFTFSKDGGATYQGSNIFLGLAPGVYTIVVKDVSDIIRAINVTILAALPTFDKAYLSKNPIPFSVSAPPGWDILENFRMFCEVRVEDVTGSSLFISKMKQELYPDANGLCLFNLRQAVAGVLSLDPPAIIEGTIKRLTDRIKFFKTYTGALQDDEVTPDDLVESSPDLVLYGGLGAFAHASIDFLGSYIRTNKKFMSWAPLEKVVDSGQEDYLNYWVFGLLTSQLKLRIKAYFDDNTNTTSTVLTKTGVHYGELYQIPAGPTNSGVLGINPAKNLVKYELWLLDQDDSLISEVRTFIINEITEPLTRFIMFVNSLGAHEVHLITGESVTENKISRDSVQKYLPPIYSPLDGQFESTEGVFRGKTSYSTGFLKSKYAAQWKAYFTDLMMSKKFYDVTNGSRYPMQILTDTIPVQEDHKYDHFVRFEAGDAYQNAGYTPPL